MQGVGETNMNIKIEIKTKHPQNIFELRMNTPEWAEISTPQVAERRDGISQPWAIAIVSIIGSVPAAVIASFILNKIVNKESTTITINRKQIDLEEGQIVRVIEEIKKIQN